MKKKTTIGVLLGAAAGTLDVIPMIIQNLTWDANLSAFAMWVIVGFFYSVVNIKLNVVIKGIFIAFLLLTPTAILIAWREPISLIPIFIMTVVLGSALGWSFTVIVKNIKFD